MIIESNLGDIGEIKNLNFKYGCVIPTFERQEYVTSTFLSISRSFIPKETIFIIIDDCSEFELFLPEEFYNKGFNYIKIKKSKNLGVANSLAIGFDILNLLSCEFFINLDSDVEVLNNWLIDLHKAYKYFGNKPCIVTGFNGFNHKIIKKLPNYNIKRSLGGINLFFSRELYKIVRMSVTSYNDPVTFEEIVNKEEDYGTNPKIHLIYSGWDWQLVKLCYLNNITIISTSNSVIQHIGKFGLNSSTAAIPDFFEVSLDFKKEKKKICFVFPDGGENCGGYIIQDEILNIINDETGYETIKIKNSQSDLFIKKNENLKNDFIIVVFWGPLVDEQISKFKDWNIVYWAHSCGYQFKNLKPTIPVIAVSRNTMQYFASNYNNPIFLLYSPIEVSPPKLEKDIDIFVQKRKCSKYVLDSLIPALKINKNINIMVLDQWLGKRSDFLRLLERSKIYIYDSKDYWNSHKLTEGFGIPPIEALMKDCIVFSSLNNALSDVLDPLVNCFQITGNVEYDIKNIELSVNNYEETKSKLNFEDSEKFSKKSFLEKFDTIIKHLQSVVSV